MQGTLEKAKEAVRTVLTTCAGLKTGEKLLIASDSAGDSRVDAISSQAKDMGGVVTIKSITGGITREPPENVASAMLENDITILCVNEQRTLLWGHADAKVAACKKGARVLFLTQQLESTPLPNELEKIRARSHRLADLLEKSSKISLVTEGNNRLQLKLAQRKSLRLSSILSQPGSWGAIPDYSEAAVAPLETGSEGVLRVNGIIVGLGRVRSPVDLEFRAGRLVRISGDKMGQDFDKLLGTDPSARVLCEIGFGTNHLRKEVRGEFDDKKALGSVHIALGDNHTFGGNNRSSLHVDCLVTNPTVYIDDRKIDLRSF